MNNITKKQWGMAGTSIGSLLIIVALLTMVGVGSNDTYAAETCTCPSGYTLDGTKCTRIVYKEQERACCLGGNCSGSGYSTCTSGVQCDTSKTEAGAIICQYPKIPNTETIAATCTTTVNCPAGQYHVGQGHFATCPAGYYCPGGPFNYGEQNVGMNKCPEGTTSEPGKSSPNDCNKTTSSTITCEAGEYSPGQGSACATCIAGYYCPGVTASAGDSSRSGINACPSGTTSAAGAKTSSDCNKTTSSTITCEAGKYFPGQGSACATCLAGYYCPGVTTSAGDSSRSGINACPSGTTSKAGSTSSSDCKSTSPGNPSDGSGGNPSTPSGGDSGLGGNSNTPSGGDSGLGGNSNTPSGGDSGLGGNGDNGNTNQNPNTATKTPLVIAIIGTMSMALGTFAYFKGKKEINTEI